MNGKMQFLHYSMPYYRGKYHLKLPLGISQ